MDESASGPLLARRPVNCVSIREFTMRHNSRTERKEGVGADPEVCTGLAS